MQDLSVRHGTPASIRRFSEAPKSAIMETPLKKPAPFVRSTDVDGGRFSNIQHRVANGTRRLFGRQEQPSFAERLQQAAFLDWRESQLAALQGGNVRAQAPQMQGQAVYQQIDHPATQSAMEEAWHQWRLKNPGSSHQVGNQSEVVMTYF
ncbi:hypothetical protein ACSFA3_17960 [Variovorax sp. RHLX14]|uniref:hypothetical protein n=1 Tax=Variovorax sp. RHLX14 TaxID=1259731 RepID=UPI003F4894EE